MTYNRMMNSSAGFLALVIGMSALSALAEAREVPFPATAADDFPMITDLTSSDVTAQMCLTPPVASSGSVTVESTASECACLGPEIKEVGIECIVINTTSEQVVTTVAATGYTGTLKMRAKGQKSVVLEPNSVTTVLIRAPIEGALWGCDSVGDCGCKKVKARGVRSNKNY